MKWSSLLLVFLLFATPYLVGCATSISGSTDSMASFADRQLVGDIQNRLGNDTITSRFPFSISANGGTVTIGGYVTDSLARRRAVSIVRGAPGVQNVIDQMSW